ncbi:MAG: group II intron maturase-specific domain-containing protein [Methylocella sp.]
MAKLIDPVVRGWMNYYGRYYRTKCIAVLHRINAALARWARRKYKRLRYRKTASVQWLGRLARRDPSLFVSVADWYPTVGRKVEAG